MGNSISFCPNNEFITNSDVESGIIKTTVEYPKGSSLKLFCDYGNLSALKKLKEISPSIANEKYLFYKREIQRMIAFLSTKEYVMVESLIVYKITFYGTVGYDAHSINNDPIFIEFCFNGICKRKDKIDEMIYIYQWRKDGVFINGDSKQTVEFKDINQDQKIYVGGSIEI